MNSLKKCAAVVGVLAVSVAAYCARAGLDCEVFVPRGNEWKVTPHRLYQLISYNAKINFVPKHFALSSSDYYFIRNNNMIFTEGLKTISFEVCDQLGWELPDHIIVPVGSGSNLIAIDQSINELIKLGLVKNHSNTKGRRSPKIHGVTVGSSSSSSLKMYEDVYASTEVRNRRGASLAIDGLTIAPELVSSASPYLEHATAAIKASGGSMVEVFNNDLINSVSLLASYDGILASPTGAAAVAGLLKLVEQKVIERDENVVCVVTGSGEVSSNPGNAGNMTDWKILKAYNKIRQSQKHSSSITLRDGLNYSNVVNTINNLGITKAKILSLLDKKSDYAYSLNKGLSKSSKTNGGMRKMMAMSTLYQHLNELERFGMIARTKAESFRGRPIRFYYNITVRGKRAVKKQR